MAKMPNCQPNYNLCLCEVADLIKTKQVSAVETLQACFERIDMLDPVHHAFGASRKCISVRFG
jgi:hypothetical protein